MIGRLKTDTNVKTGRDSHLARLCDSIGVIGAGVVGSAVARGFLEYCGEVRIHDVIPERSTHTLSEACQCDFVFACLPTPMKNTGECDTRFIEELLASLPNRDARLVLRSTIPPGTTVRLATRYDIPSIVHSPEFLTARCAFTDFCCPSRNIIGRTGSSGSGALAVALFDLYTARFPGVPVHVMSAAESELTKLVCNSFFATKLSFFNEMYQIANALGCRFGEVMKGVLSDGRIGASHHCVPGPVDHLMGWGGVCFPKDVNDLMSVARSVGISPLVLEAAWEKNLEVREVRDWESHPSAVSRS